MNETVLFLHVLSAFLLMITVVVLSASALGSPTTPRAVSLSNLAWDIGGLGTLVFGVWLALDTEGYSLGDGWIVAALVLWVGIAAIGARVRQLLVPAAAPADAAGANVAAQPTWVGSTATLHWIRVALVVLLLADMIFKPGAGP